MKYTRNSGSKKPEPKKPGRKKKEVVFSKDQEKAIINQLVSDAEWVTDLAASPQFSKEWINKVQLELLMQCMGKKDVFITNMFGQQLVARVFKDKGAAAILTMIAKMEGHLFDTVKGSIKGKVDIEHNHTIELKPNVQRTVEVFEILERCGALKSPIEQIGHTPLEQIHSA